MLLQNRGIVYSILDNVEFETQSRSSIEGPKIKFIKIEDGLKPSLQPVTQP